MTIEYKDSKRIVALSTDYVPDISDVSDSNWTVTGLNYAINSGVIDWDGVRDSSVDGIHIDLGAGNISDTQWVLRFKMVTDAVSSPSSGSNVLYIAVSDAGVQPQATGSEDSLGYYERRHSSTSHKQTVGYGDEASLLQNVDDFNTTAPTTETKYIEMKRTSATSFTVTRYSDEFVTVKETAKTVTIPSTIQSLRYIKIQNKQEAASGGTFNGTISDIKFWNDTTTAGVTAKNHLTNVQDNSLLIEKDVARRYWSSGYSPANTATFTDDFSSDNWTDSDSTNIGVSSGALTWSMKRDNTNDASVRDLTSTSDNWVLRFKVTQGSSIGSTAAGNGFFFGISDSDQSVAQNGNQDFVGMAYYYDNQSEYNAMDSDGTALPHLYQGDAGQNFTITANDVFYFEIIKNGSSYTVEAFTNSDYSTGSLGKITGTTTATGLRYLKIMNELTNGSIPTSTNPFNGTIDDLKFYNNVTNVDSVPATWINEFGISNGLIFGGVTGSYADYSDSQYWNGVSWTAGGSLTGNRANGASAGTGNTSARYVNGYNASPAPYPNSNRNESYNGTSWTSDTNHPDATNNKQNNGCGTADNMLVGNGHSNGTGDVNNWYKWTGSWTSVTASGITGHDCSLSGTLTSAIQTKTTSSKTWNGTAWTSVSASGVSRSSANASGTSSSDAFRVMSTGSPPTIVSSELWNGTAWTASGNAVTAKSEAGSTNNFSNNMMIIGGQDPSATQSLSTQEYRKGVFTTGSSISGSRRLSGASG